jgi:hypothetical protein
MLLAYKVTTKQGHVIEFLRNTRTAKHSLLTSATCFQVTSACNKLLKERHDYSICVSIYTDKELPTITFKKANNDSYYWSKYDVSFNKQPKLNKVI